MFYVSSVPTFSLIIVTLLCCYKIRGYVLSQSTVFIRHPVKHFLVFPKDLSLSSAYYLLLSYSIKHSKLFLVSDTIEMARSIISATRQYTSTMSLIPFTVHVLLNLWNFILTKLNSEVQCLLHIGLKKHIWTHMYCDLLLLYYNWLFLVTLHLSSK